MKRGMLMILMMLVAGASAFSQADSSHVRHWIVPDFLPLQYAGKIGLVSTGIGYYSNEERYLLAIHYGYVPASHALTPIHTITARNIFPFAWVELRRSRMLIPYAGIGFSAEIGGVSFFRQPDNFPKSYYDFPKNLHVLPFAGARLRQTLNGGPGPLKAIELYGEAGTIDVYLWYKTISNQIRFSQVFSVAIGFNFVLKD